MANKLKMAILQSIQALYAQGWSQRRIAQQLGVDRGTVGKYLRQRLEGPKPAILPAGWSDSKPAILPTVPAPVGPPSTELVQSDPSKPAILPTGSEADLRPAEPSQPVSAVGRRSDCQPYRDIILAKVDLELSARRIWQDLVTEHGAQVGYDSVRRFVRQLVGGTPLPFRRLECAAGEVFQQHERAALLPPPLERFACFHEAKRKVHLDGHVEVAKAYYSVPPEYLRREVWVRWDSRLVRVFNQRFEPIESIKAATFMLS